jgi:hypothetical protein
MVKLMNAKMKVSTVTLTENGELLVMEVVTNGSPEDNTYSQFTPSGSVQLHITNKDLEGGFVPGQVFYVQFTEADSES